MYLCSVTEVIYCRRASLRTLRQASLSHLVVMLACCLLFGKLAAAQTDTDLFETEVRPLLIKHCYECHGPKKQESDLRLDSKSFRLAGHQQRCSGHVRSVHMTWHVSGHVRSVHMTSWVFSSCGPPAKRSGHVRNVHMA